MKIRQSYQKLSDKWKWYICEESQKKMPSTLLKQGSLTTDYWKQIEAGGYILKLCAAQKTDAEVQRTVSLSGCT